MTNGPTTDFIAFAIGIMYVIVAITIAHRTSKDALDSRRLYILWGFVPIFSLILIGLSVYNEPLLQWQQRSVIAWVGISLLGLFFLVWLLIATAAVLPPGPNSGPYNRLSSVWIITDRQTIDTLRPPNPYLEWEPIRSIILPIGEVRNDDVSTGLRRFELQALEPILVSLLCAGRPLNEWLWPEQSFVVIGLPSPPLENNVKLVQAIYPNWTDPKVPELLKEFGATFAIARFRFATGDEGALVVTFTQPLDEAPVWLPAAARSFHPKSTFMLAKVETNSAPKAGTTIRDSVQSQAARRKQAVLQRASRSATRLEQTIMSSLRSVQDATSVAIDESRRKEIFAYYMEESDRRLTECLDPSKARDIAHFGDAAAISEITAVVDKAVKLAARENFGIDELALEKVIDDGKRNDWPFSGGLFVRKERDA